MQPSSADTGFFQPLPELKNQFYDDVSFQRVLTFFVPPHVRRVVEPELAQLGDDVLDPRIFDLVSDAERNLPYVRGSGRNAVGQPTSELVTGAGWRGLQAFGMERGFVAYNYTTAHGAASRVVQMLRFHLWEASAACTTCPGAMTDGAARLLQLQLAVKPAPSDTDADGNNSLAAIQRRVLQRAYDHLTARDPAQAWTSGQWMTERAGGSDVSQTETVARWVGLDSGTDADGQPLGPWALDGFKWFSSATDANMTILLARTRPDAGLSAFYAPMRRQQQQRHPGAATTTELNGVRIQRLKDKSGTRPVPTAELELRGMRAWLLGDEGHGVRALGTVLAITRVHCAVNCLGLAGRALGVAKAYARVRTISGGPGGQQRLALSRSPLHMHTLAALTGEYHGLMLLTLLTAHVMGREERGSIAGGIDGDDGNPLARMPPRLVAPLLRALSSLHKAYVCKQAVPLLHGAGMEALGGIGFLLNSETEPLNVARLFRDGCVNAIWEGTTDVLSTDLVRTLRGRAGAASLDALAWVVHAAPPGVAPGLRPAWAALRQRIETTDAAVLLRDARDVLFAAAELLIGALLVLDAARDEAPAALAMCRRFLASKGLRPGPALGTEPASAEALLRLDTQIVYGMGEPEAKL